MNKEIDKTIGKDGKKIIRGVLEKTNPSQNNLTRATYHLANSKVLKDDAQKLLSGKLIEEREWSDVIKDLEYTVKQLIYMIDCQQCSQWIDLKWTQWLDCGLDGLDRGNI